LGKIGDKMKKIALLLIIASKIFADPGIMIDIDIIIHGPSGSGDVEIACR
jgi:hypothetical protein